MLIDESRIVELMKEHYQIIYLYCLSLLRNEADAKDVTQDVFELFMEKAEMLEDNNIRSWLFEVASRKVKRVFRERQKQIRVVHFEDDTCEIPELVDELQLLTENEPVEEEEIVKKKDEILNSLKPHERELYSYVYEEKLQYAQIAQKMGLSEKAVNVRSFRLKQKIKEMVKTAFLTVLLLILSL